MSEVGGAVQPVPNGLTFPFCPTEPAPYLTPIFVRWSAYLSCLPSGILVTQRLLGAASRAVEQLPVPFVTGVLSSANAGKASMAHKLAALSARSVDVADFFIGYRKRPERNVIAALRIGSSSRDRISRMADIAKIKKPGTKPGFSSKWNESLSCRSGCSAAAVPARAGTGREGIVTAATADRYVFRPERLKRLATIGIVGGGARGTNSYSYGLD
jgi:hypothetical protein